ncbi:MAG: hypothetical protein QM781_00050 [Chitinophagaceae bacterium]
MEPILINRSTADLKLQIDFLIKREFFVTYFDYKRVLIYFSGWTLAVLALSTLTDSNNLVTLKVVLIFLTAIAWLVGLVILVTIIIKRQKRVRWRDTTIKSFLAKEIEARMTFDEEKLTFITETYKTEIKWDYYKFYAEHKNSIFFIPEENLYGALCFSPRSIGQDNFEQLKSIAKTRLKLLDEKNGKQHSALRRQEVTNISSS